MQQAIIPHTALVWLVFHMKRSFLVILILDYPQNLWDPFYQNRKKIGFDKTDPGGFGKKPVPR